MNVTNDILSGPNTATCVLSNSHALKIQLIDSDRLYAQFIGTEQPSPIVECEIEFVFHEDTNQPEPCFYYENDKTQQPYYLSDFIRDDFGR